MTTVVRPYRGVSAEDRRADRRARLKSACLDLIGSGGVVSITAEAVSGRASLTKRYFYESFADRDALLYEVMDDFFVAVRSEILDALAQADAAARSETGAGADPTKQAHIVARVLIDHLQGDGRQARLYVEAAGQPTLQARREAAFDEYTRLLVDAFSPDDSDGSDGSDGPDGPDDSDGPEASDTVSRERRTVAGLIIVAGVTQAAVTWLQGRIQLARDDVINEIARMILIAMSPPGHDPQTMIPRP
jgi:AcrR family transcriptional regulator